MLRSSRPKGPSPQVRKAAARDVVRGGLDRTIPAGAGRTPHGILTSLGTIPARAGSRWPRSRGPTSGWGHPHVRGEQMSTYCCPPGWWGPPLRTRGAGDAEPGRSGRHGTIPARAGSSSSASRWTSKHGGHPCGRGEQTPVCPAAVMLGSPPRARGQAPRGVSVLVGPGPARGAAGSPSVVQGEVGTIPTCVGSRSRRARRS